MAMGYTGRAAAGVSPAIGIFPEKNGRMLIFYCLWQQILRRF